MSVYIFYICNDRKNVEHHINYYKYSKNIKYIFIGNKNNDLIPPDELFLYSDKTYCFDIWAHAMQQFDILTKINKDDRIFFIDSICRGPFFNGLQEHDWINKFSLMINDNVKLAGVSINCYNNNNINSFFTNFDWKNDGFYPHVQSFFLATDMIGLQIAFDSKIFVHRELSITDKIFTHELGFSIAILSAGYNINCILPMYKNLDYHIQPNISLNNGMDPFNNNNYFGQNIKPFESFFVRTDRRYIFDIIKNLPIQFPLNKLKKFNYCVFIQKHEIIENVFREVALGFVKAIEKKGYKCIYSNTFVPDHKHIIFGANTLYLMYQESDIPIDSIIVNLEQLSNNNLINSSYISLLRNFSVWDYSLENIKWLNDQGIKYGVKHINITNFMLTKTISNINNTEDIDILFYGSENSRRKQIETELKINFPDKNIVFMCNLWGQKRDNFISRSKIVLNIHYHEAKIFEIVRIAYLMINNKFIISEDFSDISTDNYKNLLPGLVICPYDKIIDKVSYYLGTETERNIISHKGYEIISSLTQEIPLNELNIINNEPLLSILICSITTRTENLHNLISGLENQIRGLPVQLLTIIDNRKMTIGEKRNNLINMAIGKYIVMIDDDDSVSDDYVDCLIRATGENSDVIVFNMERYCNGIFDRNVYFDMNYTKNQTFSDRYERLPNHLCCYKRSVVKNIKYPHINNGEDFIYADIIHKIINTQTKIKKNLYKYEYNDNISVSY